MLTLSLNSVNKREGVGVERKDEEKNIQNKLKLEK